MIFNAVFFVVVTSTLVQGIDASTRSRSASA